MEATGAYTELETTKMDKQNTDIDRIDGREASECGELLPCPCMGWARTPDMTNGVLTKHHPRCEQFEGKKIFAVVNYNNGGRYVVPLEQVGDSVGCDMDGATPGDRWTIEIWEAYQEEVDALPEFTGH